MLNQHSWGNWYSTWTPNISHLHVSLVQTADTQSKSHDCIYIYFTLLELLDVQQEFILSTLQLCAHFLNNGAFHEFTRSVPHLLNCHFYQLLFCVTVKQFNDFLWSSAAYVLQKQGRSDTAKSFSVCLVTERADRMLSVTPGCAEIATRSGFPAWSAAHTASVLWMLPVFGILTRESCQSGPLGAFSQTDMLQTRQSLFQAAHHMPDITTVFRGWFDLQSGR